MRTHYATAALLLLGTMVAQDTPAKEPYAKLLAEFSAAQKENAAKVKEVTSSEEYKKAVANRDREAMGKLRAKIAPLDYAGFTVKFEEGASKFAGKAEAVPFLTWIAHNATDKTAARKAVDTLVSGHVDTPAFLEFVEGSNRIARHFTPEETLNLLEKIGNTSKLDSVRAHAMYTQAQLLMRPVAKPKDGSEPDAAAQAKAKEAKAKADQLMETAGKLAAGTPLAERINAPKFAAENLAIGKVVPDIVGEDLDGVPFKLSDYRGKVIVLDFWGDW